MHHLHMWKHHIILVSLGWSSLMLRSGLCRCLLWYWIQIWHVLLHQFIISILILYSLHLKPVHSWLIKLVVSGLIPHCLNISLQHRWTFSYMLCVCHMWFLLLTGVSPYFLVWKSVYGYGKEECVHFDWTFSPHLHLISWRDIRWFGTSSPVCKELWYPSIFCFMISHFLLISILMPFSVILWSLDPSTDVVFQFHLLTFSLFVAPISVSVLFLSWMIFFLVLFLCTFVLLMVWIFPSYVAFLCILMSFGITLAFHPLWLHGSHVDGDFSLLEDSTCLLYWHLLALSPFMSELSS